MASNNRIESELKCSSCFQFFTQPVLLSCSHSLCYGCAQSVQITAQQVLSLRASNKSYAGGSSPSLSDLDIDIDKLSLNSEADSGVVCQNGSNGSSSSRPNSYAGTLTSLLEGTYFIRCPTCKRLSHLGELGIASLTRNHLLENIIERYVKNQSRDSLIDRASLLFCQLCEESPYKECSWRCEQCEIYYCDGCRDRCHPMRGPFLEHNLIPVASKASSSLCTFHNNQPFDNFCLNCRIPVCKDCTSSDRHLNHNFDEIGAASKAHKTNLSVKLQHLSSKAKAGAAFLQNLKCATDNISSQCMEYEAGLVAQIDALLHALERRKQFLLTSIETERDYRIRSLKEQYTEYSSRIQKTSGLLHYCVEALKEVDHSIFLQVAPSLVERVTCTDQEFTESVVMEARCETQFEMPLNTKPVLSAIEHLGFFQMQDPGCPLIVPNECSAENNCITVSWQPTGYSHVEGYILELDDASANHSEETFREVYCGPETACTVDGLHFGAEYRARVKSFNQAGESAYSSILAIQTAEVAWFTFDELHNQNSSSPLSLIEHQGQAGSTTSLPPPLPPPPLVLSNNNLNVSVDGHEDRTVLCNVSFARGIHYWEFIVEAFSGHPDPAFGVARADVHKDSMLGKDARGWSMYIDSQRSWLIHADCHTQRCQGGVQIGSVIGILLDLESGRISFFVDNVSHGTLLITNPSGHFLPAVSLNRNVEVRVRSGLEPPPFLRHYHNLLPLASSAMSISTTSSASGGQGSISSTGGSASAAIPSSPVSSRSSISATTVIMNDLASFDDLV